MAFTYAWTAIPDSDTDPDSPVTTGLVTGMNHDLIHLREWIGASFFSGAVPDHSHDGVNSVRVALTGESLFATHYLEVFDHFTEAALDTGMWTVTGSPVLTVNGHYAQIDNTMTLTSKFSWR